MNSIYYLTDLQLNLWTKIIKEVIDGFKCKKYTEYDFTKTDLNCYLLCQILESIGYYESYAQCDKNNIYMSYLNQDNEDEELLITSDSLSFELKMSFGDWDYECEEIIC